MKRGQKLMIIGINKGTTAASEAVNDLLNDDLPKAIYSLEYAIYKLTIHLSDLKAFAKSQKEGG